MKTALRNMPFVTDEYEPGEQISPVFSRVRGGA